MLKFRLLKKCKPLYIFKYMYLIETPLNTSENRPDTDQAALTRVTCSGSTLFAYQNTIIYDPTLVDLTSNLFVYSRTCLKRPLKNKTDYCLMKVKSITECSKGSILQYFRPSVSYHLLVRSLFWLFLSGRLRQG